MLIIGGWNDCFKTFRRGWWVCRVAWTIIVISYLAIPSIRTCQSDQVSYVSTLWRSHHRLGSTAQPSNPRKRVVKPPHRASRPLAQSPHRLWRPPAFCPTNCGSTSDYLGLERAVRSAKYVRILQIEDTQTVAFKREILTLVLLSSVYFMFVWRIAAFLQ